MACISVLCRSLSITMSRAPMQHARSLSACCSRTVPNPNFAGVHHGVPSSAVPSLLLCPSSVLLMPTAGMKQMGKLRRRCKHCFFIMIEERLHVWCDAHPRHKQMQMISKAKTVIRTTHATQGKLRPW